MLQALAASVLVLVSLALSGISKPPDNPACEGCEGLVGSASATGGSCPGASVTIEVSVAPGKCKGLFPYEEPAECLEIKGCKPTITTSWTGVPSGTTVDTCIQLPNIPLWCTHDDDDGSGSGSVTHPSPPLHCKGDSNPVTFSAKIPACGALAVSVDVLCTKCEFEEE
jgi:hypothetical protein